MELSLSANQLEQINACFMHLQVTTLAEITDHMGTTILAHVLSHAWHDTPVGLTSVSHSTLQWPQIHPPSPVCWKLWMKTICSLFTGSPVGTQLNHSLGPWTAQYQTVQTWHWRLSSNGWLLHQPTHDQRPWAAICNQTPMYPNPVLLHSPHKSGIWWTTSYTTWPTATVHLAPSAVPSGYHPQ